MARKLRVQIPGGIYLLMSRGDRREDVFRDDGDRSCFLETLEAACNKTGWQVHAYCLLPNHFHLVVETPKPNLVAGMKWFLGTYTARFNRRHSITGHLFAGRYKSQIVSADDDYFREVCDYVHLNPVRAGLLTPDRPLESYLWSSYGHYLNASSERPAWLRTDRLVSPTETGTDQLVRRVEGLRGANLSEQNAVIRSQWCIGSPQFRRRILETLESEAAIGPHHFGPEVQQAAEVKASRIINEELLRCVWTEAELLRKQKGDPVKIKIAQRLRQETTVTLQWIAARLHMGAQGYLSHLLYWERRAEKERVTPREAKTRTASTRSSGIKTDSAVQTPAKLSRPRNMSRRPNKEETLDNDARALNSIPSTDPFTFDPSFD